MTGAAAILDVTDASDFWQTLHAFHPIEQCRTLEWCEANIVNQEGRPYDHAAYPHIGAPGGPMDANDDPRVREISLQWATRLGKTFLGQCVTIKNAATNPGPQMFASATEKLAKEVVHRTYGMARARRNLAAMLVKSEKFQRQDLIEFRRSRVFVAWARSVSTLADKNVKYGHANEIPKWEYHSTSKEAHPLKLFSDRFKDFWSSRKIIFEGTPTIGGKCPIESRLEQGTNCRLYVPCHSCGRYQTIEFGNGDDRPGGVKWEKQEGGRSDGELAKRTAHYQCEHCLSPWLDHHRPWAIRRGVWVPAGCEVDDAAAKQLIESGKPFYWTGWRNVEWIKGTPLRDGDHASYQLSSLYALSLSWGDVAREFVESKDRPQKLQNFINQWLGKTFYHKKVRSTPESVGERLRGSTPRGTVPLGGLILTVEIDRQGGGNDDPFIVYGVIAHGLDERAWLIDYGIAATPEDIWDSVIRRYYPHADGGPQLQPVIAVIDSGFKTHETYLFCQAHAGVLPVKGSGNDLGGSPYKIVTVGADGRDSKTGVEGQMLMHVNTDYWEQELQTRLDERSVDAAGSLVLCPEASRDAEFLEQLLNGVLSNAVDPRGNQRLMWIKKDENFPNDFRDMVRYGLCAARAWIDSNGGAMPLRAASHAREVFQQPQSPLIHAGDSRPDGRGWLER